MRDDSAFTIGQLAAQAGVAPRTIRLYTAEGLLPPPVMLGGSARYLGTHLERLIAIRRLKARSLPLSAIREHLARPADLAAPAGPADVGPAPRESAAAACAGQACTAGSSAESDASALLLADTPEGVSGQFESWGRVPLAPGVELHLQLPGAPEMRARLHQLVQEARDLFSV